MRRHAPIVVILLVAAVARYWAIDFCLPSTLCRPDEEAVASISTLFFTRHFNPHFFDWPSFFMYEVSAGLVPLFKTGLWMGWYRGERHFVEVLRQEPSPVYLTARFLSAGAGVLSVWLLSRITLRLAGQAAALVAALFLGLAFLHVRDSHFGVTDVTATCLMLASFLFTVRLSDTGARRDLLLAAALAGLATSTKYNAAIVSLPLFWVVITSARVPGLRLGERLRSCGLVAITLVGVFVLTSPYSVIEYQQFLASLRAIAAHLSEGHSVNLGRGWAVHLTSTLRFGLGVPLLASGLAGLLLMIGLDPRKGVVVALFPLAYYAAIGSGYTVFARYILPVVPFLCLTAAVLVSQAGRWVAAAMRRPAWQPTVTAVLALAVIAPSAWSVIQFDRLLGRTDGRVMAETWVRQRFPAGATIGEIGRGSTRLHFVEEAPGVPSRYRSIDVSGEPSSPDILVVPTSLFDPHPEVNPTATAMAARYVQAHVIATYDPAAQGVVYDWQDEFYLPLTGFDGIWRPGPSFTIYLRPDLANASTAPRF